MPSITNLDGYAAKRVSVISQIVAQGELALATAGTTRLSDLDIPCSRVVLRAPTANNKKGAANTGNVLVGNGTARIAIATNPADGDTLTITDGAGKATVFEFDSNGAVTTGRVSVEIGEDAAHTLAALLAAIQSVTGTVLDAVYGGHQSGFIHVAGVKTIATSVAAKITLVNPNVCGGDTLDKDNYDPGLSIPCANVKDVYVSILTNNDAVEWQAFAP